MAGSSCACASATARRAVSSAGRPSSAPSRSSRSPGLRFLGSAGLALPREAPRGERYRQQPDLEDWITLIEDYALRCLAADPSPAAAARHDAIAAALREFGFTLTRQGVRRGAGDVDRVLTASAAKPLALVELVGCEIEARGPALRAVVLADAELAAQRPDAALREVLAREAGTAIAALRALADDVRTAPLRPLLVTGRGVRCAESDADALTAALRAQAEARAAGRCGAGAGRSTRTAWRRSRRSARNGARAPGSASPARSSPPVPRRRSSVPARCSARAGTHPA